MFRKVLGTLLLVLFILGGYNSAGAEQKADVDKIMEMVLNGVEVVQQLGEESFPAFDDLKGEFVWKNPDGSMNNAGVGDCKAGIIVGDIEVKGLGFDEVKDATGRLLLREVCELATDQGSWIDYQWPDMTKDNEVGRQILFFLKVPDTEYVVWAGAWDNVRTLDELNALIK